MSLQLHRRDAAPARLVQPIDIALLSRLKGLLPRQRLALVELRQAEAKMVPKQGILGRDLGA